MIKDKIKNLLNEDIKDKTTANSGHFHYYILSKDGNGETTKDNTGHQHKIITFAVQPAGEPSHKHKIIVKQMGTGFGTNEFISSLPGI